MDIIPPIIVSNSPIEFILIGPQYGRDRVLMRSDTSSPELIGHAMLGSEENNSSIIQRIFFRKFQPINLVKSKQSKDLATGLTFRSLASKTDIDPRRSSYIFAWRGLANPKDLVKIEKTFQLYLTDLSAAISNCDNSGAEQHISPTIYLCSSADRRIKKQDRLAKITMTLYALAGLLVGAVSFLTSYLAR